MSQVGNREEEQHHQADKLTPIQQVVSIVRGLLMMVFVPSCQGWSVFHATHWSSETHSFRQSKVLDGKREFSTKVFADSF